MAIELKMLPAHVPPILVMILVVVNISCQQRTSNNRDRNQPPDLKTADGIGSVEGDQGNTSKFEIDKIDGKNAKGTSIDLSKVEKVDVGGGGNTIGNGGDGVFCSDTNTIELLDFFEADFRWQLSIGDETNNSSDIAIHLNHALNRLRQVDSNRAAKVEKYISSFWEETTIVDGLIANARDSELLVELDPKCKLVQIAFQRRKEAPTDKYYYLSRPLYESLSVKHKAGLILHEVLYRDLIDELGTIDNSIAVRYFTALYHSSKTYNLEAYMNDLVFYNIPFYKGPIALFPVSKNHFTPAGELHFLSYRNQIVDIGDIRAELPKDGLLSYEKSTGKLLWFHTFALTNMYPIDRPLIGSVPLPWNKMVRQGHGGIAFNASLSRDSYFIALLDSTMTLEKVLGVNTGISRSGDSSGGGLPMAVCIMYSGIPMTCEENIADRTTIIL